jgi:hypothetical protein
MVRRHLSQPWLVIVLLLFVAGCRPGFRAKTPGVGDLKPNSFKFTRVFDQPSRQTTVLIAVNSWDQPVDVFVLKSSGEEEAQKLGKQVLETGKAPDGILAGKQDLTDATLEVPIGNGASIGGILVVNRSPKPTTVKIRLAEK